MLSSEEMEALKNFTEHRQAEYFFPLAAKITGSGGGGGVHRILSDGDDRRIFLGLKLSIPVFFFA